jgi:predicted CopG family antitoxin
MINMATTMKSITITISEKQYNYLKMQGEALNTSGLIRSLLEKEFKKKGDY